MMMCDKKFLMLALAAPTGLADPWYRARLPSGYCFAGVSAVGHEQSIFGGAARNKFGKDFKRAGKFYPGNDVDGIPKWFCIQDSDDDGIINAAELGDPDCKWLAHADDPVARSRANLELLKDISDPGDAESRPACTQDDTCPPKFYVSFWAEKAGEEM